MVKRIARISDKIGLGYGTNSERAEATTTSNYVQIGALARRGTEGNPGLLQALGNNPNVKNHPRALRDLARFTE